MKNKKYYPNIYLYSYISLCKTSLTYQYKHNTISVDSSSFHQYISETIISN